MIKTLLLENDPPDLVDKIALRIAEARFPGYQVWGWFGRDMHRNRKRSLARLMSLESGDRILMRHVFAYGFGQMEGMLMVLDALREKGVSIEVWMVGMVTDDLFSYLRNDRWTELEGQEKEEMNERLLRVLEHHRVMECWDNSIDRDDWPSRQQRITRQTFESMGEKMRAECKHMSRTVSKGAIRCLNCDIELTKSGKPK